MIYDQTLTLSDAQAITATAASTNYIDLGDTGTPFDGNKLVRDVGAGTPVPLAVSVGETFNTLTSLTIEIQTDDNTSFSSPQTHASVSVPLADLTSGKLLEVPDHLPEGTDQRYLRLLYTVVGTDPTTGNLTAGVVAAKQTNTGKHYAG